MVEAALAGFEHEIHLGMDLEKVSLTEWLITSALGWWFKATACTKTISGRTVRVWAAL